MVLWGNILILPQAHILFYLRWVTEGFAPAGAERTCTCIVWRTTCYVANFYLDPDTKSYRSESPLSLIEAAGMSQHSPTIQNDQP
jgi:hypothetical protein